MKMTHLWIGLAALPAAATAQSVDVGAGDWSAFPEIRMNAEFSPSEASLNEIERIARQGDCAAAGLGRNRIRVDMPFAIRIGAGGRVERIVIRDVGCRPLETMVGTMVLQLAMAGELRPEQASRNGWYRSELAFSIE